jgi:hypothetical protein
MTVAMKAISSGSRPMPGTTVPIRPIQSSPTIPPRRPLVEKAKEVISTAVTDFALTGRNAT